MKQLPLSAENKKKYIQELGKILVQEHGKEKFYTPEQVKEAYEKKRNWAELLEIPAEAFSEAVLEGMYSMAMSVFSSHEDFDAYHSAFNLDVDFIETKTEMLNGFSTTESIDWANITDIDLDGSWLDFGDVFEGVLEGIGTVISGIFDGL